MPRSSFTTPEPRRHGYTADEVGEILSRAGDLDRGEDRGLSRADIADIAAEFAISEEAVHQAIDTYRPRTAPESLSPLDRWFGPASVAASRFIAESPTELRARVARLLRHRRLRRLGPSSWAQDGGSWPDPNAVFGTTRVSDELGPAAPDGSSPLGLRATLTGIRAAYLTGVVLLALVTATIMAFLLSNVTAITVGIVFGTLGLVLARADYRSRRRRVGEELRGALDEIAGAIDNARRRAAA